MTDVLSETKMSIPASPGVLVTIERLWRTVGRNKLSLIGSLIVLSLALMALSAPFLGLANPVKLNIGSDFFPLGRATGSGPISLAGTS